LTAGVLGETLDSCGFQESLDHILHGVACLSFLLDQLAVKKDLLNVRDNALYLVSLQRRVSLVTTMLGWMIHAVVKTFVHVVWL